jgi:hypothetical protein
LNRNESVKDVDLIFTDLLKSNNFLADNMEINDLCSYQVLNKELFLGNMSQTERQKFEELKAKWHFKLSEVEEKLYLFEQTKRINLNTENRYLKAFGNLEIEKSLLLFRISKNELVLKLINEQPELSPKELIKKTNEILTNTIKEVTSLRQKTARASNCIESLIDTGSQSCVTDEFKDSYIRKYKKLQRKLFFLLHSDTCPNYSNLSDPSKEMLNSWWLELMESTNEEFYYYTPMMFLYQVPDYEKLLSIYRKVCEILDIWPEDFETENHIDYLIRMSHSPDEVMDFMKNDIERLGLHLALLDVVKDQYTNCNKALDYLDKLERFSAYADELGKEIAKLKVHVKDLEKKLPVYLIDMLDEK